MHDRVHQAKVTAGVDALINPCNLAWSRMVSHGLVWSRMVSHRLLSLRSPREFGNTGNLGCPNLIDCVSGFKKRSIYESEPKNRAISERCQQREDRKG